MNITNARPLKVTLFSDATYFGGAEMYLALLARHLPSCSCDLTAVLPVRGADQLRGLLEASGVRCLGFGACGREELARLFLECSGQVLHLNLPSTYDGGNSLAAWAARAAGYSRIVTTEHLPMVVRKWKPLARKLYYSSVIDAAIVMTRENRRYLSERHGFDPLRIRVIPNGVEEPDPLGAAEVRRLRDEWGGDGAGQVVLGTVAAITPRKGHRYLLEAVAGLAEGSWRLVLVGDGEAREALQRLAAGLGIEDRVAWLGSRPDAARIVQAMDVFVLPSLVETMPLTILEAMAAGVPVVATAIYGVPEMVTHDVSGVLVPPASSLALRGALERLISSPATRSRIGAAGRRRFEQAFRADRMARQTAAVYRGDGD